MRSRSPQAWIECAFDLSYLLFLGIAALWFGLQGQTTLTALLATMTVVLGAGDACHLLPRVASLWSGQRARFQTACGIGKLATSIGMTVWYLLLFSLWQLRYPTLSLPGWLAPTLYVLAALRIAICLFPQNGWITGKAPPLWACLRNLPFFLIGLLLIGLFCWSGSMHSDSYGWMPLAIGLSFAFYLPVALFSDRVPALGMLMLPKTMLYVWMTCMGFALV